MFCMKAHQLSIVLPSKSRLVQLRMYTIFPELLTFDHLYYSDVMILFDLYIIFELFLKL